MWINNNKSVCTGGTVFNKHDFLIMPIVTAVDALLKVADGLTMALDSDIPQSTQNQEVLEKITDNFKENAKVYRDEEAS